jgi:biofilm PGA synthesis protein PgaA
MKKVYLLIFIFCLAFSKQTDGINSSKLEIDAKKFRNDGIYNQAVFLYNLCIVKNNKDLNCKYGLILSLADYKKIHAALYYLSKIKNKNYYYYFLKGYVLENGGEYYDSFVNYQKSFDLNPQYGDALKGLVRTLDMLGLPYLAYKYMRKNPSIFNKNYVYRLKKDEIAFKIRWGEMTFPDDENRFKQTDEALKELKKFISLSKVKNLKKENPNILQARFDEIVALRDRYYMNKVINNYKKLKKAGIKLPYYVLSAVADAYLYNKQPEKAIKFYKKTLKINPRDFESKIGVFYCYVEMFELNKAIRWIDKVNKNQPAWIRGKYKNEHKIESAAAAADARYYADYMEEAQKRFEKMCNIAPANVDLRSELASIYKDRGWDRKAIEETDFAIAYEKNNKNANLVKALALFDIQKYRKSEKLINSLYKKYPEDLQVQRAKRLFEIYKDKYQLLIDAVAGSTNGVNYGNNYYNTEVKLYSKPVNYNYRVYFLGYYSKGTVEEGKEIFKRLGLAVEYKKNDLTANTGILINKNVDKNSWFMDGKYFFTDKWIAYASYESYASDTPLRALKNRIYANALDFVLTYRSSESRETDIEFKKMDFNDSNVRRIVNFSHYERVITGPYYKLNTTFSYSVSTNTKNDAIYFNPSRDRYIGIDFENIWHIYRRYSYVFSHVLGVSLGNYWQSGYSSHPIWSVRYEHRWDLGECLHFIYGIARNKNYYGDKEYDTSFYLNVDRRF